MHLSRLEIPFSDIEDFKMSEHVILSHVIAANIH